MPQMINVYSYCGQLELWLWSNLDPMCVDSYVRIYKQTLQNILMPHPAVIAGSHKIKSNILDPAVPVLSRGKL